MCKGHLLIEPNWQVRSLFGLDRQLPQWLFFLFSQNKRGFLQIKCLGLLVVLMSPFLYQIDQGMEFFLRLWIGWYDYKHLILVTCLLYKHTHIHTHQFFGGKIGLIWWSGKNRDEKIRSILQGKMLQVCELIENIYIVLCHLVLGIELLNPLHFLDDKSIFCSNEMTLDGLLDSFRVGAGLQKYQTINRNLELSAPPSILWDFGGALLEIELIIHHAYMMKCP